MDEVEYSRLLIRIKEYVSNRYDVCARWNRVYKISAVEVCTQGYNIYFFNRDKSLKNPYDFDYVIEDCYGCGLRDEGKIDIRNLSEFLDDKCIKNQQNWRLFD